VLNWFASIERLAPKAAYWPLNPAIVRLAIRRPQHLDRPCASTTIRAPAHSAVYGEQKSSTRPADARKKGVPGPQVTVLLLQR
jgi:hypothetical protein